MAYYYTRYTYYQSCTDSTYATYATYQGAFIAARNRHEVEGTGDQIDKNGHSVRR